ncbi:MAG: aminotransferase class I/II-fold pyridoxal phosphate-dependent enzyme [Tatlockia sp.]|jgi:8-amino-7-oxononanoate synthase
MLKDQLVQGIALLQQKGLHRKRQLVERGLVNFSSNDYLSITEEPALQKAFAKGFLNYPSGSGGSMVVCGYHPMHRALEQAFSSALAVDDALLFSSGYAANLAIIALLRSFKTHVIIDKGVHASFYDGLKTTGSPFSRYFHTNLDDLRSKLKACEPQNAAVITESIFSMSGQASNLLDISQLAHHFKADCLIDEAHAFGVLGPEGLGAVMGYGLTQKEIPLRIIPFGKALGLQGAVVAGSGEWIDALLQFGRASIYSTAMSPAVACGLVDTLSFIRNATNRRNKLFQLIDYFTSCTKQSALHFNFSTTPIQQLKLGCPQKALLCAKYLQERGVFCQAIRSPTVTKEETGLRIILNFAHEPEHIDALFFHLNQFEVHHAVTY